MPWLLLTIGTVCVVECFLRLPLLKQFSDLRGLVPRILGVLRSKSISDHWKEKILPVYALKLFKHSILLFIWVVIGILPILIIAALGEYTGVPMFALLGSLLGIAASTLIAVIYIFIRNRVNRS